MDCKGTDYAAGGHNGDLHLTGRRTRKHITYVESCGARA